MKLYIEPETYECDGVLFKIEYDSAGSPYYMTIYASEHKPIIMSGLGIKWFLDWASKVPREKMDALEAANRKIHILEKKLEDVSKAIPLQENPEKSILEIRNILGV